ncbi:MAG: hypothetical protein ACHQ53_07145 [Polyangiales bacterium]
MASSKGAEHGRTEGDLGDGAVRAELEVLARVGGEPPDVDALFAEVQQQMQAERGAGAFLRSRSTTTRVALVVGSAAVLVAMAALRFPRPDIELYPQSRMLLSLVTIGALGAACLWLAMRPLQLAAPPAWLFAGAPLAGAAWLVLLYLLPEVRDGHPASFHLPGFGFAVFRAVPCFVIGLGLALPFLSLLVSLDRGGLARSSLMAAGAGLLANFLLQVICPVTAPLHMLLGHLGVLVLLLAIAPLLGRSVR